MYNRKWYSPYMDYLCHFTLTIIRKLLSIYGLPNKSGPLIEV